LGCLSALVLEVLGGDAGDTTLQQIQPLLEQRLSVWKAPAEPLTAKQLARVPLPTKPRVFLVNRTAAEQSLIFAVQLAPPRSDPANIVDHGYPLGAINLAGQTPIILVNDWPDGGGFINPYTVPGCAFWKLGQSKPGEIYHFQQISVTEAQAAARRITALCTESSIETL
jgi:hypothetical protein